MKKVALVLILILNGVATLYAQKQQVLYDFYEIPNSLLLNPGGKAPQSWHVGFPALSRISFYAGSSGVSTADLLADDGVDFTTKFADEVIYGMNFRDDVNIGQFYDVLYGGFRGKNNPNNYYSFGLYGEGYLLGYWPQDIAQLTFEGNANALGRRFNLNHIAAQGEGVGVFHFGINKKVNSKWQIGVRAKLYSSVFEIKSTRNSGYFVTTEGENNIIRNTLVADIKVRTSGIESLFDVFSSDATTEEMPGHILRRALLGGNLGLGFDAGFTYNINPQTTITGSIQDVGFIYHSNDVKNYTLNGAASNEGVEIRLPEDLQEVNADFWQELVDEIETLIPFETNTNSYVSIRPTKLNGSFRYNWGERGYRTNSCECSTTVIPRTNDLDYVNAAGAQLFAMYRPRGPYLALTGFYQRRIGNVMAFKTTYTVDKYTLSNIGLGLNFQFGPVNLFVLGDNLLAYRNIADSQFASFQFGLNIISWNNY